MQPVKRQFHDFLVVLFLHEEMRVSFDPDFRQMHKNRVAAVTVNPEFPVEC